MKLEIDTKEDSHEAIRAAVQMLQAHLQSQGVVAPVTNYAPSTYSQPSSYASSSYDSTPMTADDRLAKKIAKSKAREESYTSAPAMSMFDAPATVSTPEPEEDDDDVSILTY